MARSFLCLDIDCDARLEFHGEVVGEDANLLNELFDQRLIKLCDVSFLSGDEVLVIRSAIAVLLPEMWHQKST